MKPSKWAYYISKFTLLDEILGFLYWALAIFGIFVITNHINHSTILAVFLGAYIIAAVLIYLFAIKNIKKFFNNDDA